MFHQQLYQRGSFPGPRCLSTVLVLLEFGSRFEDFELVHCYHAPGFPVLVPHMTASGLSELISIYGCTGSSSVPISACNPCGLRWFLLTFTFFTNAFCGHWLLTAEQSQNCRLKEFQFSVLCDLQVKYVDLHQDLVLLNACKALFWARLWGPRLLRAMNYPMDASLRKSMLVFLCDHWCASCDQPSLNDWPVIVRRSG